MTAPPLVALAAAAAFGAAAYGARALTAGGAVAGAALAWMLLAWGGAAWAAPALTFFVLSSALSRAGRRRKRSAEALAAKGDRRDAAQVAANGGVAAACLAVWAVWPAAPLYGAFVGAFAAAAADTWGTEIGTWAGGRTRRLGVGGRVPPGTSGGVSAAGTAGAAAGALSVALAAVPFAPALGGGAALAVAAAGLAGAFADTALGATLQARFRAPDGSLTERSTAAGRALPLAAGRRWLGNDGVNLACTLVGAALGALVVGGVG
ncbi:DUF92 domain-containing protein [Rubrivirga sp. S365]|uniref:DUF92 domain-containing protein n=1 Tax=Rubrivirga sp. S365 TaxID=3076080 RepID=UPI0028C59668|nr:DUF92 domain-containing protein [Rubrivirga sp. S365]MDT7857532.1 DUF92 domain-containing protein [Rubrivirga sp. S365]